jgi:hypothetical protein
MNLQFSSTAHALELFRAGGEVFVPAVLFEAGTYPDRGLTVTEEHLDGVVARFNAGGGSVEVRVEHQRSPLDPLGHVVGLRREGKQLRGMLVFSEGIYQHIKDRRAGKVSVAFHKHEDAASPLELVETSLVLEPRVASAQMLDPTRAAQEIATFRAAGKLTPAMEQAASKLLALPAQPLTFSDSAGGSSDVDVAAAVRELFSAMPVLMPRGGQVPAVEFKAQNVATEAEQKAASMLNIPVENIVAQRQAA